MLFPRVLARLRGDASTRILTVVRTSILRHRRYGMVKSRAENCIFLLEFLVAFQRLHQFGAHLIRRAQLGNASFEVFDVLFRPLTDGSLGFSVVCSFSFELCRSESRDAASASSGGPSFGPRLCFRSTFRAGRKGFVRSHLLKMMHGSRGC